MVKKLIFSRCVAHFNKNHGAYDLLLATVVATIAIISLLLAVNPPDKEADIQLYTDAPNDIIDLNNDFMRPSFNFYIFNGGTAPCFDVILTTHSFIQKGEMILPERKIIPALVWDSRQETEFYLDIIHPDETIKINLESIDLSSDESKYLVSKLNPTTLKVECVEDSAIKKVFLKES